MKWWILFALSQTQFWALFLPAKDRHTLLIVDSASEFLTKCFHWNLKLALFRQQAHLAPRSKSLQVGQAPWLTRPSQFFHLQTFLLCQKCPWPVYAWKNLRCLVTRASHCCHCSFRDKTARILCLFQQKDWHKLPTLVRGFPFTGYWWFFARALSLQGCSSWSHLMTAVLANHFGLLLWQG